MQKGKRKHLLRILDAGGVPSESEIMESSVSKNLADFLQTQRWDAFFTATFKQHQRYSATALAKVKNSLLTPRLRPVKTFVAAEQHKLGGWHCHGLIEFPRSQHLSEYGICVPHAQLSELGFNQVSIVSNANACSIYLSKYITKDDWTGDWLMTGREKYWKK